MNAPPHSSSCVWTGLFVYVKLVTLFSLANETWCTVTFLSLDFEKPFLIVWSGSTPLLFWEYTIDYSLSCKSNGKKFSGTESEIYGVFHGVREVASDTVHEPQHDKTNKMAVRPAKTRISWESAQSDQSSLSAWRTLGFLATHWAHSEYSDQADLSLRWAHTHFVGFVMSWLTCLNSNREIVSDNCFIACANTK